nr:LAGLIDADG endonuclease [Fusarium culmorum]AKB93389.1 LAGLIDADG endonuclease [Fusarium graminearum]CDL73548.1 Included in intron of cob n1 TaxSordaria macrospora k-hell RepIDF7WD38_SORMK [Fusarium culmorum CS7071]AKE07441.1 LAGLIDADG endonuclease [Fusarium culmorum]QID44155.1 LAGLIDADG endonuclease [Fusarium culmorum]CAB4246886.1 heg15 [Fusarium culmorum]
MYLCLFEGITLSLFIFVSGYKNKMGFRKFTNSPYLNEDDFRLDNSSNKVHMLAYPSDAKLQQATHNKDFLYWFSGFTDAEGNFLVSIDRKYIKLRFKINLHIDDIEVLYIIKSKLGFGRVVEESSRNSCSFIVEDSLNINKLCDIFKQFPLHTSKKLDFISFNEVVIIKAKNKVLSETDIAKIISIKNSMNSKREVFTYDTSKSQIIINPNWLIGFIEGEGTFGIKTGSALYFQVAQKNTSQECLNGIINFLMNLSNNATLHKDPDNKILPISVTNTINIRTNVVSLAIANVDGLYYYLLPYLDSSKFYSRKAIDFKLWKMALLLKIKGYYYTTEGKNLFLDISDTLNKRYSTMKSSSVSDINNKIINITERFNAIIELQPPFDVKLNIPHTENVRKYSIANRSENPKIVYIYDGSEMVKGSPFASFSTAHKALGLKPSSNTCNRYIDTNKLYKNKYIFTSKPIDSASRD